MTSEEKNKAVCHEQHSYYRTLLVQIEIEQFPIDGIQIRTNGAVFWFLQVKFIGSRLCTQNLITEQYY